MCTERQCGEPSTILAASSWYVSLSGLPLSEQDVSYGRIQDRTPGKGYDRVLKLTIGVKAWAFALGAGYIMVDKLYLGSGLTMTRKRRDSLEDMIPKEDQSRHPLLRRVPVLWVTYSCLVLLAAFVVTAWVLFFRGLAS